MCGMRERKRVEDYLKGSELIMIEYRWWVGEQIFGENIHIVVEMLIF